MSLKILLKCHLCCNTQDTYKSAVNGTGPKCEEMVWCWMSLSSVSKKHQGSSQNVLSQPIPLAHQKIINLPHLTPVCNYRRQPWNKGCDSYHSCNPTCLLNVIKLFQKVLGYWNVYDFIALSCQGRFDWKWGSDNRQSCTTDASWTCPTDLPNIKLLQTELVLWRRQDLISQCYKLRWIRNEWVTILACDMLSQPVLHTD